MVAQKSIDSHLLVPVGLIDHDQQDERLQSCPTDHSNPNTLQQHFPCQFSLIIYLINFTMNPREIDNKIAMFCLINLSENGVYFTSTL